MIWRIRDRRTFRELRRHGRRARSGSVTVTFLADSPAAEPLPPRFAFALPRKVGNAVERNRIRRVVQGRLPQLVAGVDAHTAAGAYLVAVRSGSGEHEAGTVADRVETCLGELWSTR